MKLKQIIVSNPLWLEVDNETVREIIERSEKENCFFNDDLWVPSGAIVLGIVNARKEGEDYRALLLVAVEIASEKQFVLSSAIVSFGMSWHEKYTINQQLSSGKEEE